MMQPTMEPIIARSSLRKMDNNQPCQLEAIPIPNYHNYCIWIFAGLFGRSFSCLLTHLDSGSSLSSCSSLIRFSSCFTSSASGVTPVSGGSDFLLGCLQMESFEILLNYIHYSSTGYYKLSIAIKILHDTIDLGGSDLQDSFIKSNSVRQF